MSLVEIRNTLQIMVTPGDVVELRVFDQGDKKYCGWFNNMDRMAEAALSHDDTAEGTYYTCNACVSEMLAIANNRIIPCKTATSEKNMLRRRIIGIDIDPRRNPPKISSTDGEHEAAIYLALEIKKWLKTQGWPDPVMGDSGNGAHLDYFVDLPVTEETKAVYKRFFMVLKKKFSTGQVDVQGFEDANRIWKLYGTWARKGENLPNRPHRISSIMEVPTEKILVTLEQIKAIADNIPEDVRKSQLFKTAEMEENTPIQKNAWDTEKLKNWLDKYNIEIARTKTEGGRTYFILKTCIFNPEHTGNTESEVHIDTSGVIGYKCHHNSCSEKHWTDARELFEPGYKQASSQKNGKENTQAKELIRYVEGDGIELFHDENQVTYARVKLPDGHNAIYPTKGTDFKRWLLHQFYRNTQTAAGSDAIINAMNVIEAKASFDGKEYTLHNRICWHDGAIWYDMGNWEAVKITSEGWKVVKYPPILFQHFKHQRKHGDLELRYMAISQNAIKGWGDKLMMFINISELSDQQLFQVYLISCFIPAIPHPIAVVYGDKGAAKSTLFKISKAIIDPSTLEIATFPKDNTELVQRLSHHYYNGFDNVSHLSDWQSDALCRASTGEGFSKRSLYTDDEDIIYNYRRCIGLNGINVVATKPDVLDRSILFKVERIPKDKRKTEIQLWKEFDTVKSDILSDIFSIISKAIEIYPTIDLIEVQRMADFTVWGCAIAEAMKFGQEAFLKAYEANINIQNREAIDSSPVGELIIKFMEERTEKETWQGKSSELLTQLEIEAEINHINIRSKFFPKTGQALTRAIGQIKTNLLDEGILFEKIHKENFDGVFLQRVPKNTSSSSRPPAPQAEDIKKAGDMAGDTRNQKKPKSPVDEAGDMSKNEKTLSPAQTPAKKQEAMPKAGDTGDTGDNFRNSLEGDMKNTHTPITELRRSVGKELEQWEAGNGSINSSNAMKFTWYYADNCPLTFGENGNIRTFSKVEVRQIVNELRNITPTDGKI